MSNTPSRWLLAGMVAAVLLPLTAKAQDSRTTAWVNMRAGPASDFPLVARVGPNTPLEVQGCTPAYDWCDVIAPGIARGWVYAAYIAYSYENSEVPVFGYGGDIGLPIIGFSVDNYWGRYYRQRPWYGDRSRFEHRWYPGRPGGVGRPYYDHDHDRGRDHDHDRGRPGRPYVEPSPQLRPAPGFQQPPGFLPTPRDGNDRRGDGRFDRGDRGDGRFDRGGGFGRPDVPRGGGGEFRGGGRSEPGPNVPGFDPSPGRRGGGAPDVARPGRVEQPTPQMQIPTPPERGPGSR